MPVCPECGSRNLRFHRSMTNVDKYWCRRCEKVVVVTRDVVMPASTTSTPAVAPPGRGFLVFDHQGKEGAFVRALEERGWVRADCGFKRCGVRFALTDNDTMGRRARLEGLKRGGVGRFFMYPHAARPNLVNDIYEEWSGITAHFVVSRGHAEIMQMYGYSRPVEPVGWSLCPIRPFRPRSQAYRVLFAPIHPRCSPVDQEVNRATFSRLEKLARAGDIHLTVRFIRDLGASGLERVEHPQIEYTVGVMNNGFEQIDRADVVVAHQTFMYLAVARGAPAVTMASDMPTHIQQKHKPVLYARNWRKYEHLVAFPLDLLQARDPLGMLRCAAESDRDIADWRRRMIGQPFRKERFIDKLESYL